MTASEIRISVQPDGGEPYEVIVDDCDLMIFQRTSKGRNMGELANGSIAGLYRLAWIACKRQRLFTGDLGAFERACDLWLPAE